MSTSKIKYNKNVLRVPFVAVVIIWTIYVIDIKFKLNLNSLGIYPQHISGLKGILFSPFLHSDTKHLFNNSIPLFVLLAALIHFYEKISFKVVFTGLLLTGFLTWTFGRPAYHIGASGIIYLLVSFIFFSGIIRKYYRLVALSLAVVFLYGGMIWYIFPVEERISWEGHLSGFLVGSLFAYLFRKRGPQNRKFEFSENLEFESMFDEDGNFIGDKPENKETE